MKTTIIDSHAHLGWDSFAEDREEVIQRAFNEGVCQMVNAGVYLTNVQEIIDLCEQYDNIYGGVGLHPHEAQHWAEDSAEVIRKAAKHPKVVAIGECGLDFYYNHSPRELQIDVFKRQIELALELDKPLIIHTRDAWEQTFDCLTRFGKGLRGVFHCFTGGPEVLPEIDALNFYVSFSGIVTFPKSTELQDAARLVKSDKLMVETDCPYLAPQGKRGKRNEPSFVWFTAQKLAELRQTTVDDIAKVTSANARTLFNLPAAT